MAINLESSRTEISPINRVRFGPEYGIIAAVAVSLPSHRPPKVINIQGTPYSDNSAITDGLSRLRERVIAGSNKPEATSTFVEVDVGSAPSRLLYVADSDKPTHRLYAVEDYLDELMAPDGLSKSDSFYTGNLVRYPPAL